MIMTKKLLKKTVKFLAISYALVCVVMYSEQRSFMYHPAQLVNLPETYGLSDFTKETLLTKDKQHVEIWYHKANGDLPTIIHIHGNGGNLSHRVNFFELLSKAGFGVIGLDYRGYGNSDGIPSEQGFYNDARATLDFTIHKLAVPENKIILFGESIGTGVSVQMATEYNIGGLVLQSPFTSMTAAASYHYPWLPVSLLLADRYDSMSKIANIHVPMLFLHGEIDTIVPIAQGKELYAHAPEPKKAIYFADVGHNNFNLEELIKILLEFSKTNKLME